MEREVRYCTTEDGVRISYCPEGEGRTVVVLAPLANIELTLATPAWTSAGS